MPNPTLAANALIEVEEYLNYAGISPDNPDLNEPLMFMHINAVSQALETYLGRKVCPTQDANDTFYGDGEADYYVDHMRINAAPTLYYWDGDSWEEMTTSSYPREYLGAKGLIWLTQYVFEHKQQYKCSYNTGWDRDNVPDDLKLACMRLTMRGLKLAKDKKEGVASETFGDQTTRFTLQPDTRVATGSGIIPPDVLGLIARYKKVSAFG